MFGRPTTVALLVVVAAAMPFLVTATPSLIGADASYVVASDSMEPAIPRGSLVFVTAVPPTAIEPGDTITFYSSDTPVTTTHRIVAVVERADSIAFRTQGDAVANPDHRLVPSARVVGTVTTTVPWFGFVVERLGVRRPLVTLLVVPSVAVVLSTVRSMVTAGGETP
jgi:signal peptidase